MDYDGGTSTVDQLAEAREQRDALRAVADGLAKALHRCEAYLPLFIEDGPKLRRAMAVHEVTQEALGAYCELVGIDRQELHRWTCE